MRYALGSKEANDAYTRLLMGKPEEFDVVHLGNAIERAMAERDAWERFARQLEPRAYLCDAGRGPGVMVG